jgi:hypothetical protein
MAKFKSGHRSFLSSDGRQSKTNKQTSSIMMTLVVSIVSTLLGRAPHTVFSPAGVEDFVEQFLEHVKRERWQRQPLGRQLAFEFLGPPDQPSQPPEEDADLSLTTDFIPLSMIPAATPDSVLFTAPAPFRCRNCANTIRSSSVTGPGQDAVPRDPAVGRPVHDTIQTGTGNSF